MKRMDSHIVMERADELAQFTSTPGALTRTYLSNEHQQAHQALSEWMEQAGLETWQDSVVISGDERYRLIQPNQPLLSALIATPL